MEKLRLGYFLLRIAINFLPAGKKIGVKVFMTVRIKARKLLKWEPKVSLEDGLKATIDYFRRTL